MLSWLWQERWCRGPRCSSSGLGEVVGFFGHSVMTCVGERL